MKNILVALELEYDDLTKDMLTEASQLAKAFDAKCWLVHVASQDPDFISQGIEPQYVKDVLEKDMEDMHIKIQTYANDLMAKGVEAEGLIIKGSTTEILKKEVEKLSIDLLVLGNKQHSFIFNIFVSSTTDKLIDYINVPVLLVPEKK